MKTQDDKKLDLKGEDLPKQDEEQKKDYQQEEDEDVNEKRKTKKIVIAIALFVAIFFIILLIWYIKDNSLNEISYIVDGDRAAPAVAQAEEEYNEEGITLKGAEIDLTGKTADVVIPLEFFKSAPPEDALSDTQQKSGYTAVKKSNGNITYSIKTSYFNSIVSNLYDYYNFAFDEAYEKKLVQLVSSNKTMNTFTITIDKDSAFNANKYYSMLEDIYYQAAIYQCYYGFSPEKISVNFQFKYSYEQFTFADYQFPECLNKDLSKVSVAKDETTSSTQAN